MNKVWMNTLAWVAAVMAALTLSFAGPDETSIMGRLPSLIGQRLGRQPVALPQGLPADRTLALIAFHGGHRKDVESWINGLQLRDNPSISWVRMPVLNDPGNAAGRTALENHLMARYPSDGDRANLMPVFTDRAAFVRSAGLGSTEQVYAVVINRQGEVLARVEGQFDERKAQALRETLQQRGL
ncbi:hypothetical protein [Variovorax terrae]|uniref:Uncharacterized protein n=1 Tax=Variovorax terrae TaxID=2923278 RepID=A0A9X2AP76_9BURK|nr:hypothetical protein [Variovorax terrae]MCJ0765528.1 hypothetical protein [Variovorax terrae]